MAESQCYTEKKSLGEVSQELLDSQVNPAVREISGHIVLKRKKDYEEATADYAWRLLVAVSLSNDRFQEVKGCIFEATGLVEAKEDAAESKETSSQASAMAASPHLPDSCLVLQ